MQATIHQVWYQGEDALPPKYRGPRDKLRRMNPEWQYILWDDKSLRRLCRRYGYEDAYDAGKIMHQRIDFGRYVALLAYGGISIDMDTDSLRPLRHFVDEFKPSKLGVTLSSANALESSIMYLRPASRFYNNATIVCPRPNMPEMRTVCDHMAKLLRAQRKSVFLRHMPESIQIQRTTGPLAFTDAINSVRHDRVEFIPAEVFEPCIGFDKACSRDPNKSITHHMHDGTWHSFGPLFVEYYWVKRRLPFIVCLLLLALFVFRVYKNGRRNSINILRT